MKKKGYFLIESLISLNIFCAFSYCFLKVIWMSFEINKRVISLSVNSREYYRMLDFFREDIENSQTVNIENKNILAFKKDGKVSKYIFTKDLKLIKKEKFKKIDIYIDNIWGEFYNENGLLIIKTRVKDERIDYVFFKK